MSGRRYVQVRGAFADRDSVTAARFLVSLLDQRLRHGFPARRRAGRVRAFAARTGIPAGVTAALLRKLPARRRPDIDRVLDELAAAGLAPPPLSAAGLEGRAGLAVFVIAGAAPMLVAKLPGDAARLEHEARALGEAARANVAPRYLGRAGAAYVQEAVAGVAMPVTGDLHWRTAHAQAAAALARLASATRTGTVPEQLREPLTTDGLSSAARRAVEAAERDLRELRVAVLQHADTSPQNCLVRDGRFAGFVDWEQARFAGSPGFDVWNLAVASLEHRVGTSRWSDERLLEAFRSAWTSSPFFREARQAARNAAVAAGTRESLLDPLEVAFFTRRRIVRRRDPLRFPTGPLVAARMVEIVCVR